MATGWRYPELLARTRTVAVGHEFELQILALEGLIEVKEKVGREKDRAVLPLYRRVLREREAGGQE